ncbi:hypothetical protein Tco_1491889 [Tanacetum coccineum]
MSTLLSHSQASGHPVEITKSDGVGFQHGWIGQVPYGAIIILELWNLAWGCHLLFSVPVLVVTLYGSAAYSSLGYGVIGNWDSRFFGKGLGSLSYGSANLSLGFGYFRDAGLGFWKCNTIYIIDKGFNMFGMDCGPSGYMYSVINNVLISSGLPLVLGSMMVLVTRWTQDFCLYFGPSLLNVEDLQVMIIYRIKKMGSKFPTIKVFVSSQVTMSDEGDRSCPICAEEMVLTEQQL